MKIINSGKVLSFICLAALTLLVSVLFIMLVGSHVPTALTSFVNGIFGSAHSMSEVVVRATPLMLAGLGIAAGLRSGFINIGAEGQLYMGAIAVVFLVQILPPLPAIVMMPVIILGSFLLGGLWALVPGFLKARFGISEVICTIMFNYIAINITGILLRTWLQDPDSPFPMSAALPSSAWLPAFFPTTRMHMGIILALACAVLVWLLIWKTPAGFKLRAVGLNPRACQVAGIRVYKHIILASILSGGLAGLAGMSEVAGVHRRLIEGFSPNYGYIAIVVALLGRRHPVGVVIAAFGIAALEVGSMAMQRGAGVPSSISLIIMGLMVLFILGRNHMFSVFFKNEQEAQNG